MTATASSTTSSSRQRVTGVVERQLRRGSAIMAIAGLGFVGYAALFFARSFSNRLLELGIGHNEVDVSGSQIKSFSPSLHHYLLHLQLGTAGFIAATGLAVAALSWFGVRRGERWAFTTALVVPVVALAVALPAHYPYHLDTLGHLGLIYADTVLFLVGAAFAGRSFLGEHAR